MKKLLTLIIFTFFLCGCTQMLKHMEEVNKNGFVVYGERMLMERCLTLYDEYTCISAKKKNEQEKAYFKKYSRQDLVIVDGQEMSMLDCAEQTNNYFELCESFKKDYDLKQNLKNNANENDLIILNSREMTIKQCVDSYPVSVCELAQQGLEKQKQEQRKIANLLQRAETTSDLETKYQAAILYLNGENGVPRNPKKAEEYLMQLAKQGYVKSYVGLGSLYFNARDYKSAKYYFEMGAKKNDDVSKIYLGSLYENGLGVPKNIFQARKIYADVCTNGHPKTRQAGCMMYDQLGR